LGEGFYILTVENAEDIRLHTQESMYGWRQLVKKLELQPGMVEHDCNSNNQQETEAGGAPSLRPAWTT
jgi:hypothetical protein